MQLAFAHSNAGVEQPDVALSWWLQWTFDPSLILFAILFIFYFLGAKTYRHTKKIRIRNVHMWLMCASFFFLVVALCSPVDYWADNSFAIHMVQHMLLIMVVAPLALLALPVYPAIRGSRYLVGSAMAKIASWKPYRYLLNFLVRTPTNLIFFIAVTWLWHYPSLYNLALESRFWHYTEHASFFICSIIFWWPIINPTPFNKKYKDSTKLWLIVLVTFQNSILAGLITFNNNILYTEQYHLPEAVSTGLAPLDDQKLGGLIMWVPGSMMYLIAFAVVFASMYRKEQEQELEPEQESEQDADLFSTSP